MADSDPVFNIPSRDYSKEPASLGEKAIATAKMVAEPYAETIRGAYRALTAKPKPTNDSDFAFGKPNTE